MQIFTKWTAYDGLIGITERGEYFDMKLGIQLFKEVHCGAIYYRAISSKKRYSYNKANTTKKLEKKEITIIPF